MGDFCRICIYEESRVVSSKRGSVDSVVPLYCLLAYLNTFLLMLETTLEESESEMAARQYI